MKIVYLQELRLLIHPRYFWMIYFSLAVLTITIVFDRSNIKYDKWAYTSIFLSILIFGYGTTVKLQPLSSFAQSNLEVQESISLDQYSRSVRSSDFSLRPEERKLEDWVTILSLNPEPSLYEGQKVNVEGFYFISSSGQAMIARYTLSCCIADARIIGLSLAEELEHEPNTWLNIKGKIKVIETSIENFAAIEVEDSQVIDIPDEPYVFN